MRILSRLPARRAPVAVATAGGAPARRERAADPAGNPRRPIQLDERPEPLGPVRGIALAVALGAIAWVLAIAVLLRF
jgi:hypothetical protein